MEQTVDDNEQDLATLHEVRRQVMALPMPERREIELHAIQLRGIAKTPTGAFALMLVGAEMAAGVIVR